MRPFDPEVLRILRTETPYEATLREDPAARQLFVQQIPEGQKLGTREDPMKYGVAVGRRIRYAEWSLHHTPDNILELTYIVSGRMTVHMGGKTIHLYPGDFFLPNHCTAFSVDPLERDDIAVNFMIKAQFLSELCTQLKSRTVLSEFLLDELRRDVSGNRYLHFHCVDDIAVHNLAETIIYAAFPYMDDVVMQTGVQETPEITALSLTVLFISLARNLDSLDREGPSNFDEIIRQSVINYIATNYQFATLQELARIVNQSESALSRQIKSIFGFTFKDLLLQKRFERAVDLLQKTQLSISDVASSVGYENTSFFYRRFRQQYGMSPNEFRKRMEENPAASDTI